MAQISLDGMTRLEPRSRDLLLKTLHRAREILPDIDLTFSGSAARYDSTREAVVFVGESLGSSVECGVSREALEGHFEADNLDRTGRLEVFHKNRSKIEGLIRAKYLTRPVEQPGAVLLATTDVDKLEAGNRRSPVTVPV